MNTNKGLKDITGHRFNRLLVIRYSHSSKSRIAYWVARCDCGKIVTVSGSGLRKRSTQSCGCLRRDNGRVNNLKHGHAVNGICTPEYLCWSGMFRRCYDKNNASFKRYGGRGIKVCSKWFDFLSFLSDMGERPSPKHSIDRFPDTNGDYEPKNCRWATAKQQARNRTNNHVLVVLGVKKCISEWSEISGNSSSLILDRLANGRSPEDSVFAGSHQRV